jgi:CIC family chloride channel protein
MKLIRYLTLQPNLRAALQLSTFPLSFWVLAIISGIGAGLGGIAMMKLLRFVQHMAWSYQEGVFLDAVQKTSLWHRWLVVASAGVLVGVGRYVIKRYIGRRGSEVAGIIWLEHGLMPFWNAMATAVFSIVLVALGAAVGREGAPQQIGAALSSQLAIWRKLTSQQRRLLAACGAGAGMAAVYNVPLGGALFASEVLLGNISVPFVIPALLTALTAVTISWISLPNATTYATPFYPVSSELYIGALILGIFAGVVSIIYIRVLSWIYPRRPSGWRSFIAPILIYMALGGAAYIFPQLLGNGKDVVQLAFSNQISFALTAALVLLRPCATIACLSSGTPGGLFTPTITIGALLGLLISQCGQYLHEDINAGAWAIIGSSAFLGASSKGPLSALVLIMELRGHLDGLIIPLTLAIITATLICHYHEPHSIYSVRIHSKRSEERELSSPK